MRFVIVLGLVAGCQFTGRAGGDGPAGDDGPDGPPIPDAPPGPFDVVHLAAADEAVLVGTTRWIVDAGTTIDTTALTIAPAAPAGVGVTVVTQDAAGGAVELVVIDVLDLEVSARLDVIGTRPVVVVAAGHIEIGASGGIIGSARGQISGPGGALPGLGLGAGGPGSPSGSPDSGGGGASFGGPGAPGGASLTPGGTAGAVYGDPMLIALDGGSGGGVSSPACRSGGAGGGAIQLAARVYVHIDGVVTVGGGGAQEGGTCTGGYSSGAGGGSGGAIYLQSREIQGTGWLAANGGGGSSGGLYSPPTEGLAGADGGSADQPAPGGVSVIAGAGAGGAGGALAGGAIAGEATTNAGGGGGGTGRIVIRTDDTDLGTLHGSPVWVVAP